MRRETKENKFLGRTIITYGLTEEQHNIAVECVQGNLRGKGNYDLDDVDEDTLKVWHEGAEGEYKEFLEEAIDNNADVYTLNDTLGGFSQPIGEVVVMLS